MGNTNLANKQEREGMYRTTAWDMMQLLRRCLFPSAYFIAPFLFSWVGFKENKNMPFGITEN